MKNKLVIVGIISIVIISRKREQQIKEEKLQKIKEWEEENLACIQTGRNRLLDLAFDPNISQEKLNEEIFWEKKYWDMMQNQPKY